MEARNERRLNKEGRLDLAAEYVCFALPRLLLVATSFASSSRSLSLWFRPQPAVDTRSSLAPRGPPATSSDEADGIENETH